MCVLETSLLGVSFTRPKLIFHITVLKPKKKKTLDDIFIYFFFFLGGGGSFYTCISIMQATDNSK